MYNGDMARKITIIGAAGRSGVDTLAEIANRKILKTGDEIVLVDVNERALGLIGEAKTAFERQGEMPKITPVNALRQDDIKAIAGSDVVVMCASVPFPKGGFRTRDWALYKNHEINSYYARSVGQLAPKSLVNQRFRRKLAHRAGVIAVDFMILVQSPVARTESALGERHGRAHNHHVRTGNRLDIVLPQGIHRSDFWHFPLTLEGGFGFADQPQGPLVNVHQHDLVTGFQDFPVGDLRQGVHTGTPGRTNDRDFPSH